MEMQEGQVSHILLANSEAVHMCRRDAKGPESKSLERLENRLNFECVPCLHTDSNSRELRS